MFPKMDPSEIAGLTDKSSRNFHCTYCDYLTSRRSNYKKHLATLKHQKVAKKTGGHTILKSSRKVAKVARGTNLLPEPIKKKDETGDMRVGKSSKKVAKSSRKVAPPTVICRQPKNLTPVGGHLCSESIKKGYNCRLCNKYYQSRSGCYKHKKVCGHRMSQLEKKILELKDTAVNEKISMQNNTINNTINNNITIQLFLDENCKNAMPLESFVKNLQITMEDLFNSNKIGYVNGLSSIIVKNLQELEITRRPIHCSDPEQLKFYVKSEKEWKKDNGDIVGKAVESVKKGVNGTVSEYMRLNNSSEAEELEVMKVLQIINRIPPSITERNQIIKNIGDSVVLNDAFNDDLY
jgi:hypothetical protein